MSTEEGEFIPPKSSEQMVVPSNQSSSEEEVTQKVEPIVIGKGYINPDDKSTEKGQNSSELYKASEKTHSWLHKEKDLFDPNLQPVNHSQGNHNGRERFVLADLEKDDIGIGVSPLSDNRNQRPSEVQMNALDTRRPMLKEERPMFSSKPPLAPEPTPAEETRPQRVPAREPRSQ